LNPD